MNDNYEKQLERAIDRRLKELPAPKAPAALSRRVMAAIHAKASLPWYRLTWTSWPLLAQVVSVILSLGLAGSAGQLLELAMGRISMEALSTWMTANLGGFAPVVEFLSAVGGAVALVASNLSATVYLVAAGVVGTMYLSCVGLGTLFYRIAYQTSDRR